MIPDGGLLNDSSGGRASSTNVSRARSLRSRGGLRVGRDAGGLGRVDGHRVVDGVGLWLDDGRISVVIRHLEITWWLVLESQLLKGTTSHVERMPGREGEVFSPIEVHQVTVLKVQGVDWHVIHMNGVRILLDVFSNGGFWDGNGNEGVVLGLNHFL